jgi:hypothetical protein
MAKPDADRKNKLGDPGVTANECQRDERVDNSLRDEIKIKRLPKWAAF